MITPDVDQWIAQAEARCEKAAPGPWACRPSVTTLGEDCEDIISKGHGNCNVAHEVDDPYWTDQGYENGPLIAQARTDLPRALRLLRVCRDTLKQISANGFRTNLNDPELHLPWCTFPDGACFCAKEAADRALAYAGETPC